MSFHPCKKPNIPPARALVLVVVLTLSHLGMAQSTLTELDQTQGDLDGDGKEERVIIYNTGENGDQGQTREIHIFKQSAEEWVLWKRMTGGVLASEAGGAMGDPYQGIEVKSGTLILYHLGGSNDRWSYNHQYRLNTNGWDLIKVKAVYFKKCEYFHTIDFDLMAGTLHYKEENDDCTDGGSAKQLTLERKEIVFLEQLPSLENFIPGKYSIKVPGTDIEIFF